MLSSKKSVRNGRKGEPNIVLNLGSTMTDIATGWETDQRKPHRE